MKFKSLKIKPSWRIACSVVQLLILTSAYSQRLTLEQAVQMGLQHNQMIKSAEYQVEYFKELKKTGSDIGKLSAIWMHGQYNTIAQDNNLTLTQSIPFPTTLNAQLKLGREQIIGSQKHLVSIQNNLVFEIKFAYEQLLYQEALRKLLLTQDSLFTDFAKASSLRYKTGESNLLEKMTAETQLMEVKNQLRLNEADIHISQTHIQALLKSNDPILAGDVLKKRELVDEPVSVTNNPSLNYLKQQVTISEQFKKVERNRILPDLTVGYFNQTLVGYQNINGQDKFYSKDKRFQGFQLGLAIPLWFAPHVARSKAAGYQEEATRKNAEYFETTLTGTVIQAKQDVNKNNASLTYYESSALQNAELIISQSRKAYRGGEIGYVEYLQALKNALSIKANYLQSLHQYNQSIIKLEFLLGKF